MKVEELIKKVHLYGDQKITIRDYSKQKTYTTKDRYCFEIGSDEIERICKLKVNTFEVNEFGMIVNAE